MKWEDLIRKRSRPIVFLLLAGLCIACQDYNSNVDTTLGVVVENATARPLDKGMVWLSLPNVGAAELNFPGLPDPEIVSDNLGNRQLMLSFEGVPVGFEQSVLVKIRQFGAPSEESSNDALLVSGFTQSEARIRSNDPEIKRISQSLIGSDLQSTIEQIGSYISSVDPTKFSEVIAQESIGNHDGAADGLSELQTNSLDSSRGEIDKVFFAAALLRAQSYPARIVAGYLDDGDGILRSSEIGLWVEYLDGKRWRSLLINSEDGERVVIPFRIFVSADDVLTDDLAANLFRGVGLGIRIDG